jgi:hypothetical protein
MDSAASIGLVAAVRITGRNKGTIHRAMTSGRLPFTVNAEGKRQIDPADLARVFPGKHTPQPRPSAKPKPKKKKRYFIARVADAAALQQRVTAGIATPDEAQQYHRIFNALRTKFRNGQLSADNARRLGIE